MAEKEWKADSEARELAEKLVEAYPKVFEGLDLDSVGFIRTETAKPSKIKGKMHKIGWPANIYVDKVYVMELFSFVWEQYSPEQRMMLIFHELLHIPSGGCDSQSEDFRKLKKHDVEDFTECIAAADMNFNWGEPGEEIKDLLKRASDGKLKETDKRVPVSPEIERKAVTPEGVKSVAKK